jgi:hypothetical protein
MRRGEAAKVGRTGPFEKLTMPAMGLQSQQKHHPDDSNTTIAGS